MTPSSQFEKRSTIQAPVSLLFDWHTRPGALERLTPPWEKVTVLSRTGGIQSGDRVTLVNQLGPLALKWVIQHQDYVAGQQFCDVQLSGPFATWFHAHRFESAGAEQSTLIDAMTYTLPLDPLGSMVAGGFVRHKLQRLFDFRHRITAHDVALAAQYASQPSPSVLLLGHQGALRPQLGAFLTSQGHTVHRLSHQLDPGQQLAALGNCDTVIVVKNTAQWPASLAQALEILTPTVLVVIDCSAESASAPHFAQNIRVVQLKMAPLLSRQSTSAHWIVLEDVLAAVRHSVMDESLSGMYILDAGQDASETGWPKPLAFGQFERAQAHVTGRLIQ